MYKEQLIAVLLKLFQRIEEKETHPKSSYEITITLMQRYYIKKKERNKEKLRLKFPQAL